MSDPAQILSATEVHAAGLDGWQLVGDTLAVTYRTGDFTTGLRLLNLIGASAEAADHHPDVTLTYPTVAITLTSHDVGGVTGRDVELARLITGHAESLGVSA